MGLKKTYTKDDVVVYWEPEKCIHSKKCWHGLSDVFNPNNKPWVNMDGASKEAIVNQVKQCPSGALSLGTTQPENNAATPKVTLAKNGPILIKDSIVLCDSAGVETTTTGPVALCRCGASNKKPFCDGSHKTADFTPDGV